MIRRWRSWVTALGLFCSGSLRGAELGPSHQLAFPSAGDSIEALAPDIAALTRQPGHLVLVPKDKDFLIFTAYPRPAPAVVGRMLNPFADSKRHKLPLSERAGWSALTALGEQLLLLNGESLTVAFLTRPPLSAVTSHTLVYDLLKPPADRGGEAPDFEKSSLRARFRKALSATPGLKLVGLAPVPAAWAQDKASSRSHYLLASRLPGFSLLTMACEGETPSQCQITRACRSPKDLLPADSLAGLAASPTKKLILVGDPAAHRVLALSFHSCDQTTLAYALQLPTKLKRLANLAIDADENLWVATSQADDYHNASLYRWSKADWQK